MKRPEVKVVAYGQAADENLPGRSNSPGLSAINYRGATYPNALARMLRRVPLEPALSHLNIEATNDWAVALLHTWAVVTEVLSFYEERILNEGFLRTAVERRSIVELARAVGYDLHPGAAAGTHLAFNVQAGQDEPPHQVNIPPGTAVQGMPLGGRLPQVFETSADLVARSDWNALRLAGSDRPVTLWPATTSIRLAGTSPKMQVGDQILIVGDDGAAPVPARKWMLAVVSRFQPDQSKGFSTITWQAAGGNINQVSPVYHARFFPLTQLGGLFGYTQAAVDQVPGGSYRCYPSGIGLPRVEVHALASGSDGRLFAGSTQDVFCSADNGAGWKSAPTGALRRNVTSLVCEPGGAIYAGTDEGGIYLSQDGGRSWTAQCGQAVAQPPRWFRKWLPFLFSAPLPKTAVRSLAVYTRGRKRFLAAGTDVGAFLSSDRGKIGSRRTSACPNLTGRPGR